VIHIFCWICETTGHLKLSNEQIAAQSKLPESQCLKVTDSLHLDKVRIWLFDYSSAHEGLTEDALNINNININLGRKQHHLHPMAIPTNNPPPKPGRPDTRGQPQKWCTRPIIQTRGSVAHAKV
jgi:hypothetical protein